MPFLFVSNSPITKVGRVVYNVSHDFDAAKSRIGAQNGRLRAVPNISTHVDRHTLTIQPHEICLGEYQLVLLQRVQN